MELSKRLAEEYKKIGIVDVDCRLNLSDVSETKFF